MSNSKIEYRILANAFHIAKTAEFLSNIIMPDTPEYDAKCSNGICSSILHFFALELYLKSLQSILRPDNKYQHIHQLDTLFNNIPDRAVKKTIAEQFNEKAAYKLEMFLEEHSNAFIECRYLERSSVTMSGKAYVLTKILDKMCKSIIETKNHIK